jgi:hypothetical protein
VNPEKYNEETIEIRKKIEKARDLSSGRKELVFRVELVRQLIEQRKLPVYTIRGICFLVHYFSYAVDLLLVSMISSNILWASTFIIPVD